MGVVYEAEEIASGRRVALKILLADLTVSAVAYERFQREARLAAAISHEHCVFVYGAHQVEGAPAIAMEIVDGETLEDKVARKEPIPIETAVRWMIDLIDGLEAAHKAGVLHRDVKPSNCFVTNEGRVKIGDFGLSRTLELDVQLTQTGQFLGSPLYASPEQVRGRALDGRSDLYSCGATMYAILTGRAPHSGSNVGEVLARILTESPDAPSSIRPEIPRAIDRVVLRAMEREPAKRFRDLAEFREALAPFSKSGAGIAARWRRIVAYMVDATLISVVSTGLFALQRVFDLDVLRVSDGSVDSESLPSELAMHALSFTVFWIGEGLFGTTIGKWIFGLRVISVSSREKSPSAAALRGLVFNLPTVLIRLSAAFFIAPPALAAVVASLGSLVSLALLFVTARRSNGWRGVHELWSGTIVTPTSSPFRRTQLSSPPPEFDLAPGHESQEKIGDYAIQGLVGSTPIGRLIKAQDSTLERSVWIHVPTQLAGLADESRRSLSRPARLRWLGTIETPEGRGDVFESPGGTSLPIFAARRPPLEWWRAHQLLTALVSELRVDGDRPGGVALEQVWIDRNWNLRVLDRPIGTGPFVQHADVTLVHEASRVLLQGVGPRALELPRDLPGRAEGIVKRLVGEAEAYSSVAALAQDLKELDDIPARLLRHARTSQLAISAFGPLAFVCFSVATLHLLAPIFSLTSSMGILQRDKEAREEKSIIGILSPEEREAHEILLLHGLDDPVGRTTVKQFKPPELEMIEEIRARHVQIDEGQITSAEVLVETMQTDDPARAALDMFRSPYKLALSLSVILAGAWGFGATFFSFVLRGGLTLSIFGVRVRGKRGQYAARWLCCVRAVLTWTPLFGALYAARRLASQGHEIPAAIVAVVAASIWIALVVRAMMNPEQSIVDRLLGTRLVSR